MRRLHFAVMLYLLLVTGGPQLRGGTLPKALTRPFEVMDRRGNAGINLGAGDAVRIKVSGKSDLGGAVLGDSVEDDTRPTGQRYRGLGLYGRV
jgi:hypothetical protein